MISGERRDIEKGYRPTADELIKATVTIATASALIGRHRDTVKGWLERRLVDPPSVVEVQGSKNINRWTREDVERYRNVARNMKSGRQSDEDIRRIREIGKRRNSQWFIRNGKVYQHAK